MLELSLSMATYCCGVSEIQNVDARFYLRGPSTKHWRKVFQSSRRRHDSGHLIFSGEGPPLPLAKSIRGKVWRHPTARAVGGHVMVLNEEHLKRLLKEFIQGYYHRARPHQGLHGDTPVPSAKPEPAADGSRLVSIPVVGGLHHRYIRVAA